MNMRAKLFVIGLVLLIVPGLIIGVTAFKIAEGELNHAGATGLQNNVRLVIKMIDALNKDVEAGKLSLKEAQERVKVQILGEMDQEGKRPIDRSINLGEYGYFFVVDEKGNTIAHPSFEGKNLWDAKTVDGFYFIRDFVEKGKEGGGFSYYRWPLPHDENSIAEKISYTEMDPNWGWFISAGSYMMDYNKGANNILYLLSITMGIFILIGIAAIYIYSKKMADPIIKVTDQMKELAEGNLKVSALQVKSKDETGQLTAAMNKMTENIRVLIRQSSEISDQVASSSEQLNRSSTQVTEGIEQVSATTEQLAAGATSQAEQANHTLEIIQNIEQEIKQIYHNATEMEESSKRGDAASNQGLVSIDQSINQMKLIEQKVSQSADVVYKLGEKSKEIGEILKVITDIAEQTNLLALNAAIEAARAGEQGRGFAVVADEVRKLAEQAGKSTQQIGQIIESVLVEADEAGKAMNEAVDQVQSGSQVIGDNGKVFEEIAEIMKDMAAKVQQVSQATEQITKRVEDGVKSVEEIAAITEESSAGTEELSASMEEQNASIQEISSMAENLAGMAEELKKSLSKFKY